MGIAAEFNEMFRYWRQSHVVRLVENDDAAGLASYLKWHPKAVHKPILKYCDSTLLHIAARYGKYDAAKTLIEHGAPVDAATRDGATPLLDATAGGDQDSDVAQRHKIAELLLARGANIEQRFGDEKRTLLQHAFFNQDPAEARFLLAHGADPHAPSGTRNKMTPLMEGLSNFGSDEMLDIGLAAKMDVNAENSFGMTALFYASHADRAIKLIEAGADPYHKDHDGRSALDLLRENDKPVLDWYLKMDEFQRRARAEEIKAAVIEEAVAACHRPVPLPTTKPLILKKVDDVKRLFSTFSR